MIIFKLIQDLRDHLASQRQLGKTIGFVPTMGALHDGHLSLVESSRRDNSITVCSIFVNPTQFDDPKDFKKYPVTIEADIHKLVLAGCDILFLPGVEEVYPVGTTPGRHYELGYLETVLEGKYRPGHFQGVCLVVHRLLDIVQPDDLFLGQKDYQQCMVIRKLIEITGHNIRLNICPTLREKDGLAMSSRNMRLNEQERKTAPAIYQTLLSMKDTIRKGDLTELKEAGRTKLEGRGFKVDYVEIADAATLEAVSNWDGRKKLVALAAVFLNDVRLIDNLLLNEN